MKTTLLKTLLTEVYFDTLRNGLKRLTEQKATRKEKAEWVSSFILDNKIISGDSEAEIQRQIDSLLSKVGTNIVKDADQSPTEFRDSLIQLAIQKKGIGGGSKSTGTTRST